MGYVVIFTLKQVGISSYLYKSIVLFGIIILYSLNIDIFSNKKTMLIFCFLFIVGCYAHFQFYYIFAY